MYVQARLCLSDLAAIKIEWIKMKRLDVTYPGLELRNENLRSCFSHAIYVPTICVTHFEIMVFPSYLWLTDTTSPLRRHYDPLEQSHARVRASAQL